MDVHLPEDAGHVAHLAHVILHQPLELLLETVIEGEGVIGLSLLVSAHESLHHGAVVITPGCGSPAALHVLEHLGEHTFHIHVVHVHVVHLGAAAHPGIIVHAVVTVVGVHHFHHFFLWHNGITTIMVFIAIVSAVSCVVLVF